MFNITMLNIDIVRLNCIGSKGAHGPSEKSNWTDILAIDECACIFRCRCSGVNSNVTKYYFGLFIKMKAEL